MELQFYDIEDDSEHSIEESEELNLSSNKISKVSCLLDEATEIKKKRSCKCREFQIVLDGS